MPHPPHSKIRKRARVLSAVSRVLGKRAKPKANPDTDPASPKPPNIETAHSNTSSPHPQPASPSPAMSSSSIATSSSQPSPYPSSHTTTTPSLCPQTSYSYPICFACVAETPSEQWTDWDLFAQHAHGVENIRAWCEICGAQWGVEDSEMECEVHGGEEVFRMVHGGSGAVGNAGCGWEDDGEERAGGDDGGDGGDAGEEGEEGEERQGEWRYIWLSCPCEEEEEEEYRGASDDVPLLRCPEYRHAQMVGPFCLWCMAERGGKPPLYCAFCARRWCWREAVSGFYERGCAHEGEYVIAFHGGLPG